MTRCFTAKQTLGKLDEWLLHHPRAVVVELGSYEGGSAVHMLRNHPGIKLYCIDTWAPVVWDKTPTGKDPQVTFLRNTEPYGPRCRSLCEETVRGMGLLSGMGVTPDLVYVDADHTPSAVYEDVATALGLWPEAHLIGDDAETPGLLQAVREAAAPRKVMVDGPVWWLA